MTSNAGADHSLSPATQPRPPEEPAATILVVDDDPALRMLFERYLTAFGYRALLAQDDEEALRIAGTNPEIRLIIFDLVIPGVSARTLCEQLTAVLPDAVFVFCSGHPASALGRLGIDIKGAQFMQKPCRPVELQQRLAQILGAR